MKNQKKKDKDAKAAEEEKKTGADDPVRKSFAPSAGIKKDADGKITVKQDEVKARPGLSISTDLETPSPGAKQPAPASRPSITAKTGTSTTTASKIGGITTPRTAHVRRETMSQKTAEIKLKSDALTEKRNLRATVGKATPGHTRMNTISGVSRPTTPRTGGLTGVATKASPGEKVTPPTKSYLTTRSSVASTGVANKTPLRGVGAGTTATKNTLSSRVGYGAGAKEETKTATTASTRGNITSRGTVSSRQSLVTTKPTDPKAPTRATSNTRGNISARESSSSRNIGLRPSTTLGTSSKTLGSTTPSPATAAPAASSAELKKLQNQLKEKQEMNVSLESMNKTL